MLKFHFLPYSHRWCTECVLHRFFWVMFVQIVCGFLCLTCHKLFMHWIFLLNLKFEIVDWLFCWKLYIFNSKSNRWWELWQSRKIAYHSPSTLSTTCFSTRQKCRQVFELNFNNKHSRTYPTYAIQCTVVRHLLWEQCREGRGWGWKLIYFACSRDCPHLLTHGSTYMSTLRFGDKVK